ncbi:hypothetical protein JCM12298_12720 [Desulfothermus naphthae]
MADYIFNSLKTKIVFWVVLILLIVYMGGGLFFYNYSKNNVFNSINKKTKLFIKRLKVSAIGPLWNMDKKGAIRLLRGEMVDKDVYAIVLLDEDNLLFAGLSRDENWQIKRISDFKKLDTENLIYNYADIWINTGHKKEKIGSVHVFVTPKFVYQKLKNSMLHSLAQFGLIILFLCVLLIVLIQRIIINRINKLAKGLSSVSQRNFSQKIPELGQDELGFLAKQYNFMLQELKKYEEELLLLTRRREVTLRSIGDGVIVTDSHGKIEIMNEVACRLTGWSEDEAKGKNIDEVFVILNEVTRKRVEAPVKKVINQGTVVGLANHTVLISRNGREIPIKDSAAPIKDDQGNILGVVMVFSDISVEVDLLKKIDRSIMFQRGLMDVVNVLILVTDKDHKLLFGNRAAEKITGYLRREVLGTVRGWELIYPDEEYRKRMLQLVHNVMATGIPIEGGESKVVTKKGDKKVISWYCTCLRGKDGKARGVLHVGIDVTEKKILEKEILKRQTLEALSLFAGGIAHDFNNILTSIMGNISLMKYSHSIIDIRKRLDLIEKAVNHASSLVSQLLSFSKKGSPSKEVTSLRKIVKETVQFVLTGSNIRWNVDIIEPLYKVNIAPIQISQILQNIIINAKQACEQVENPRINIYVRTREIKTRTKMGNKILNPGRYVEIAITDNGQGISEDKMDKIFDPFFTTKEKGHGLGLAICYSLIKAHNGEILVESSLGIGTTFRIFIPALDTKDIEGDEKLKENGKIQFSGKVLLLEDDVMIAEVTTELLKHLGFEEIVLATHGDEAINLYQDALNRGEKFRLVILDLTIPGGKGGEEVIKELLKIDPDVVGIVSSGYTHDPAMVNYKKYGFKGSLKKPYTIKELEKVLKEIFKGH